MRPTVDSSRNWSDNGEGTTTSPTLTSAGFPTHPTQCSGLKPVFGGEFAEETLSESDGQRGRAGDASQRGQTDDLSHLSHLLSSF